ncbi:RelA/SpoT family protein [Bacteroidota bacterium]
MQKVLTERKEVLTNYADLLRLCRPYIDKDNLHLLRNAVELIIDSYKEPRKKSGELYYNHAHEVAIIVSDEIGLGIPAVVAALMHDIVSSDIKSLEDIKEIFGEEIKEIIKRLLKISKIHAKNTAMQSENFIKLLISLSDDIRVVLIRLADRLAHMRSISVFPEEKQLRLAMESSSLYAPLAHRLGLYKMKTEFEETSMKVLQSDVYHDIAGKLKETKKGRDKYISEFINPLKKELEKNRINCEIKGRPKSIFSIWTKIKKQNVEFNEVYDLFAIRIILDESHTNEKADCWKVYSIITDLYRPNPNRLRDWISTPKPNGYESLHTTVIGNDGKWVEVQIRTVRMNEIAENGYAAHWKYKSKSAKLSTDKWLANIRKTIENTVDKELNLLANSKMELYSGEVFIFTPQGDLKKLPSSSSVLDFAFSIHGKVGSACTGAKVNGRIVPFKHKLTTGDTVEIITSKNQLPKSDWLNYVVTKKAISRIKRLLKDNEYKLAKEGKEILQRKLTQWKAHTSADAIHKLTNVLKLKDSIELYQMVGEGKIDFPEIKKIIFDEKVQSEYFHENIIKESSEDIVNKTISSTSDYLIIDNHIDKIDYSLAKCCNPIFGDKVFGFVTIGRGTKIHRVNCPNAKEMVLRYPYRLVKVRWPHSSGKSGYPVNVRVTGIDDFGIINNISKVVSDELDMKVRSINIDTSDGMFEGNITVIVNDTSHLDLLIKKLLKIKGVLKANRMDENN